MNLQGGLACGSTEPPVGGSVMYSWRRKAEVEERGEGVALESGG